MALQYGKIPGGKNFNRLQGVCQSGFDVQFLPRSRGSSYKTKVTTKCRGKGRKMDISAQKAD